MKRVCALAAGAAVLGLGLSGCASAVVVEAAPDAANPECAAIMLRMPEQIDGQADRKTTSQATEAWGDPTIAVLRCGVEPPGPSTDQCVNVNGVDWISAGQTGKSWRFVSYGREPAVEVLVASDKVSGATVLNEVSTPVASIEQKRSCVGAEDLDEKGVPTDPSDQPSPAGTEG